LHLVIRFGYRDNCPTRLEIAKMLVQKTDPQYLTLQNYDGNTALHLAIQNGHIKIAKMLIQKIDFQGLTVQNTTGQTPLDYAPLRIKFQLLYKNLTLIRVMIGKKTICFSLFALFLLYYYMN
jgi:ankyrin repeat protein